MGAMVATPLLMVMMSGMMFMPMAGSTSSTGAAATAACADTGDGDSGGASVDADGSNAPDVVDRLSNGTGVDLKGLKFSKRMIAGILGNASKESGVRYRTTEGHGADDADNDGAKAWARRPAGIGFIQWTGGRGVALVELAEEKGRSWADGEVQVQHLIDDLAGDYNHAYRLMQTADSARDVARIFHNIVEVSADSDAAIEERLKYADEWYAKLNDGKVEGSKPAVTPGSNALAACKDPSGGNGSGDAEYGSVGGAPDVLHSDFSWMCDTDAHVCKNGDFGPFNTFSDYQCYWYALTRLWLIHNHDVANWHTACGGDVAGHLAATPGWTVSSSPKPGDGVSQMGGALGGDTSCGHIAVVEEVVKDGSGWRIRISEGNYANGGSGSWNGYGSRWLTSDDFKGAGNVFFRKDTWR